MMKKLMADTYGELDIVKGIHSKDQRQPEFGNMKSVLKRADQGEAGDGQIV